jgi:hypothetical protein
VHFIYLFDFRGKVLGLVPLLLTKYDNEPWDEADLGKMRSRVVGRYLYKPFVFDAFSSPALLNSLRLIDPKHLLYGGENV